MGESPLKILVDEARKARPPGIRVRHAFVDSASLGQVTFETDRKFCNYVATYHSIAVNGRAEIAKACKEAAERFVNGLASTRTPTRN